jgi:hypothetical protein
MKMTCALLLALARLASAQMIDGRVVYRETREIRTTFVGSLDVDASPVGGITVQGWDDPGVLIRAEVDASSLMVAAQVAITESAGVVRATGPGDNKNREWSVSYQIFLPRTADLTLTTNVGAIAIDGVTGKIRCGASVGALQLTSLAGDVGCATSVGAISIALAGDHWDGAKLDARTNVGAIELRVPANYSAHLELSTGLGSVASDVPLPVVKNGLARTVSADLGAGGATVAAATKVGAIVVKAGESGNP